MTLNSTALLVPDDPDDAIYTLWLALQFVEIKVELPAVQYRRRMLRAQRDGSPASEFFLSSGTVEMHVSVVVGMLGQLLASR